MTTSPALGYERVQYRGSDVWCFDHYRVLPWEQNVVRPDLTKKGLNYISLLPALETLCHPRHVVYYESMTSFGCNNHSLEVKLKSFIEYVESFTEVYEDTVFILNGGGEGLPVDALHFAAAIANHYSPNQCYYITGAKPHANTFATFKQYRGECSNLHLAASSQFETKEMPEYLNFKQDLECDRTKKFHFFMGAPRLHRFLLLGLLAERDLLQHAILSYNCMNPVQPMENIIHCLQNVDKAEIYRQLFPDAIKICSSTLKDLPLVQNPYGSDVVPREFMHEMPQRDVEIYNNTWFHVTTETSIISQPNEIHNPYDATGPCLFMTEKTYRNVANGLVGVIVGQQGLYTKLTDDGYSESITHRGAIECDNVADDQERLFKQVDVIEELCNRPDTFWRDQLREYQARDMMNNKNRYQYSDKVKVTLYKC